jgi:hypothetical protein
LRVTEVASAEGHHVLIYYSATGTHDGDLRGTLYDDGGAAGIDEADAAASVVAPTGRAVSWTGSLVLRLRPSEAAAAAVEAGAAVPSEAVDGSNIGHNFVVVAAWHSWDPLFLYEQIGLAPSAVPAAPQAAPAIGNATAAAGAGAGAAAQEGAAAAASAAAAAEGGPEQWKAVVQQYFEIYNSGG